MIEMGIVPQAGRGLVLGEGSEDPKVSGWGKPL